MAGKHQYIISAKKTRSKANRSWRRKDNLCLTDAKNRRNSQNRKQKKQARKDAKREKWNGEKKRPIQKRISRAEAKFRRRSGMKEKVPLDKPIDTIGNCIDPAMLKKLGCQKGDKTKMAPAQPAVNKSNLKK